MAVNLILAAFAVLAGVAVVFQGATNQGLLKDIGIGPALLVNTIVVLLGVAILWLVTGARTVFFPASAAWTRYLGGLYGFFIIAAAVVVFPRLGAAYAIALMVCGQCLAALVIDHYGLLGMGRTPATLPRVLGVVLVVGGVAVFRLAASDAHHPAAGATAEDHGQGIGTGR